jgi:hypothetical protein
LSAINSPSWPSSAIHDLTPITALDAKGVDARRRA